MEEGWRERRKGEERGRGGERKRERKGIRRKVEERRETWREGDNGGRERRTRGTEIRPGGE